MSRRIRKGLFKCGVLLALLSAGSLAAGQQVKVAAVHFPPYVLKPELSPAGLLAQLVEALNQAQDQFDFVLRPTSVARRFADLENGKIDLAIFENPAWGWQAIAHRAVDMGLEDAEIFVARAEPGRGQDYFAELKGKRLALYNGYNYAFAEFNIDPEFLKRQFNAELSHSHDSNLLKVVHGRTDMALLARSFVHDFLRKRPELAGQLLLSERVDQHYRHHALIRPGAPISAEQFAGLVERLRSGGQLAQIFRPYGIAVSASAVARSDAAD